MSSSLYLHILDRSSHEDFTHGFFLKEESHESPLPKWRIFYPPKPLILREKYHLTLPGKSGDDTSGSCDASIGDGGQNQVSHLKVHSPSYLAQSKNVGSAREGPPGSGRPSSESLTFQSHPQ